MELIHNIPYEWPKHWQILIELIAFTMNMFHLNNLEHSPISFYQPIEPSALIKNDHIIPNASHHLKKFIW